MPQVGLKTQYQGSQGQITFFLGNKHDAPVERLIFAVPPQPQFQLQLAPVPQRIDPKQQAQVCCPPHAEMHRPSHTLARWHACISKIAVMQLEVGRNRVWMHTLALGRALVPHAAYAGVFSILCCNAQQHG